MSDVEVRGVHSLPPTPSLSPRLGNAAYLETREVWFDRRRFLLVVPIAADIVAGGLAAVATAQLANIAGVQVDGAVFAALSLSLLFGTSCLLGLYRSSSRSSMERFRLRLMVLSLFLLTGFLSWARDGSLVEAVLLPMTGVIALVLASWIELIGGTWLGHPGASTAILGTGADSDAMARLLVAQPAWGLKPVGFIADGPLPGVEERELAASTPHDGATSSLPLLGAVEQGRPIGGLEVLLVPHARHLPRDPEALYRLGARRILVVSDLGEFATLGLKTSAFDQFAAWELTVSRRHPAFLPKRFIDLAVSLPLALVASPLVGLLALAIKAVDPGPAFFTHRRVGRDGKAIDVVKLRTMYCDAEQRLEQVLATDAVTRAHWQRYFKLPQDPRILPHIGSFLRRTSLDELPQLWNVIRGDMSLVGPRPFPAYHMDAFDAEFRTLRATVPPGITGLWQISSRSDGDLGVQRAQDCFYIRNWSLWLDLYILIATLPAVLFGRGAR
jgi:lipopolysaccharide/colanic/teichoic acid biosynthesis glycosyltransferase